MEEEEVSLPPPNVDEDCSFSPLGENDDEEEIPFPPPADDDVENEDSLGEHELKYVPVKTELGPFENDNANNVEDDHFLRFARNSSHQNFSNENEEIEDRFRGQDGRDYSEISSDDPDDDNWTSNSNKRKKNTKRARKRRKVTKGRRRGREAALEKNAKITPEERKALRVKREEQRKKRQEEVVKREVEGVDLDLDLPGVSSDNTSVKKRRGRKKKVVGVALEESEAKTPRKPRQKKKRTKVVSDCDENDDDDDSSNDTPTNRRSSSASRRRRTENMTPEEHEAMKAKWREEARLKRQRLREKMTPEEREDFLAKQREQTRRRRQERSDQEKEEKRRIAAEQKRARRALLPAEKRKEEAQKVALRRIIRKSEMSEEEKRLYRMKNYMAYMARLASLPPEEIERRKQQKLEYARMRNAAMTPEMREKKKESQRKYRMNMTDDKRQRFLEGLRACYRNRIEKLKQDPVKWEEVKKKWKENNNRKKEYMKQEGIPSSRSASLAYGPGRRKVNPNETPEERAQRLREKKRQSQRRRKLQKKLTIQNLMDSGLSMEEIQRQMETPEQRERRLMNARINKAKNNLRKRLVQTGAPPEEVQHRLEELIATYQPRPTFRPYKPRADNFKRLDPIDIEFLLTAETKTEAPSEPSIASPTYSTVTVTSPPPQPQLFQQPVQLRQLPSVILQPTLQQSAQYVYSFQPETPSSQTSQSQQLQQTPSLHYQSTQSSISGIQSSYPFQNLFDAVNITSYQQQQDSVPGYDYPSYTKETINSSPPASPPGSFGHHDDFSGYNSDGQRSATPVKKPHITTLTKREYKSRPGPKNGPRGPKNTKKPVVRDQICDLCGNAYGSNYIREHKNEHHNPNWVNGKCIVCQMEFTVGRQFWKHYRREHLNITNSKRRCGPRGPRETTKRNANSRLNRDVVCEECGNAYSSHYITEHKNQHHHPNFVDRKCTICNEEFSAGRLFWRHFRSAHMGPEPERNYICEKCGAAFRQPQYLKKHEYFAHGDGLKEENYKECPVCHKKFKQGIALTAHIKRMHDKIPNLTSKYECMRCEEKFDDAKTLTDHVKVTHPNAYFPCEHCNILKYSEAGLKFHYMRCNKKPEGFLKEYREKMKGYSIERTPVECEFCGSKIAIFSLTRHYNEVHGVVEDKFECSKCGKNFKRRDFWVVHMEMIHGVPLEDMLDEARKLNVKDRDKIEVKFPKGKRRLKGAERKKALGVKSDTEGASSTQKRRRNSKATGKRRGRPKKKQVELVEDSEKSECEEVTDEDENEEGWTSSGSEDDEDKRPRRVTSLSRGERLSRRLAKRDNSSFNDNSNQEVAMNLDHSRDEDIEDNNAVAANLQIDKQLVIPITPMMTDAEIDALVKREILSEDESDA